MATDILGNLKVSKVKEDQLTLLQCVAQIAKTSGDKISNQYAAIVSQLSVFPAELEED